jgi:hypothetical protein
LTKHRKTDFDVARDELMSHIHRCGVLKAAPEQQGQWLEDTMEFMAERYPDLSAEQLKELHQIGRRFCQPIIPHGENTADDRTESSDQDEMAGAA